MKSKKVVSIKEKASADDLKLASWIAEACAKSNPSKESRVTLVQRRYTRAVTTLARTRALLARAETAQAHAMRAGMKLLKQA